MMRGKNRWIVTLLVAGMVAGLSGCAGGGLDSRDVANVVLTVDQIPQIPPITASGDPCVFTVTAFQATLANQPKNELAASPFSDIRMETVTISYRWDDAALSTPTWIQNVAGTIPVGGTQTVAVTPIQLGMLEGAYAGHTADLTLIFRGRTVDNKPVEAAALGIALSVSSCI
jgi:hypothetical protein